MDSSGEAVWLVENGIEQGGHFLRALVRFIPRPRQLGQRISRQDRGGTGRAALPTGIELSGQSLTAGGAGPNWAICAPRGAPSGIQLVRFPKVFIALNPKFGVKGGGTQEASEVFVADHAPNTGLLQNVSEHFQLSSGGGGKDTFHTGPFITVK